MVFAVARCLSVRLSVTVVYCIQTAEDIVKFLSWLGSPVILVFDTKRRYQIPRGTWGTLQRGRKLQGGGKICDYQLKSPSVMETV